MPGRVHKHPEYGANIPVYHRADGALTIHGRKHSQYMPGLDRKRPYNQWGKTKTADHRPEKQGYPHAGDGRPLHKGKNQRIHKSKKRKKGRRKSKR